MYAYTCAWVLRAVGLGLMNLGFTVQAVGFSIRVLGFGLRSSRKGRQGSWLYDFGRRALGSWRGLRILGLGLWVLNSLKRFVSFFMWCFVAPGRYAAT